MQKDQQQVINFYRPQDEYGEFNNIYKSPFTYNDTHYLSNEHFFQSQKFQGTPKEEYVRNAPTPDEAFDRGNQRTVPIRADWNQVKQDVMRAGLRLKLAQNPKILEKLLGTGNKTIVEHTVNDSYWGDGGDGSGKNRLGIILMSLREQFKVEAKI